MYLLDGHFQFVEATNKLGWTLDVYDSFSVSYVRWSLDACICFFQEAKKLIGITSSLLRLLSYYRRLPDLVFLCERDFLIC